MEHAERICDHITLIDEAHVVLDGSPGEIRRDHARQEVAIVTPDDAGFMASLPGVAAVRVSGETVRVTLDESGNPQSLLRAMLDQGIEVARFDATPATLHEIFVSLTGHGDEALSDGANP